MHRLYRRLGSDSGNALWVSILLMTTMVWVGYVSMRNTTNELKVAGNLREGLLLRQAAEGAMNKVTGMCNLSSGPFGQVLRDITDTSVAGSPIPLITCDATTGNCTLNPNLTKKSEFLKLVTNYAPTLDPDGRGEYSYRVLAQSHGPEIKLPLSDRFCMRKFDLVVETWAPGSGDPPSFAGRTTLVVQPVPCAGS